MGVFQCTVVFIYYALPKTDEEIFSRMIVDVMGYSLIDRTAADLEFSFAGGGGGAYLILTSGTKSVELRGEKIGAEWST